MKLAMLLAIAGLGLAACAEGQTVRTEPVTVTVTETSDEATTEEAEATETTTAETEGEAGVGDAIELAGNDPGLVMRVTPLEVVDPDEDYDRSAYSFEAPERGQRYVSIRLRLENVGEIAYDDSPSNGAFMIDTQDQQYEGGFTTYTRDPDLGSPTIRPGDRRVGWMTFQIRKRAKLRSFQFTLDSGFGPETGEWTLR
jgi:hypothetical protein